MTRKNFLYIQFFSFLILFLVTEMSKAEEVNDYSTFDLRVRQIAFECRGEIVGEFKSLLASNRLNFAQLFDTFYIPIPNTHPQKFNTSYDKITDETLRILLDKFLELESEIIFVVAVDRNGYLPTHNSKYTKPLTNDPDYNAKHNRTKRLFNDRTGLAAAKNKKKFLLQSYSRDTGEQIYDLSVPIFINNKHWGAIRIGYKQR